MHPIVSTIYNHQDIEANYMSINRGMDKEDVVHMHKGILLSHKKEHIWVSYNKLEAAYYTEHSKSDRERYIYCILTHIYGI